jgi:hypothetical protein
MSSNLGPLLSQAADEALTKQVGYSKNQTIRIRLVDCGTSYMIGVWLAGTKDFDRPDGAGDTVAEALEDAARKVKR